eukprot:scaffold100692_cov59-Cyclotella_meneghiniana.AAC.4
MMRNSHGLERSIGLRGPGALNGHFDLLWPQKQLALESQQNPHLVNFTQLIIHHCTITAQNHHGIVRNSLFWPLFRTPACRHLWLTLA